MAPIKFKMGLYEWGLLTALSLLWGASFFFTKIAIAEVPPLTIVFIRVSLAAACLGIIAQVTRQSLPHSKQLWHGLIIMALLNNVIPFSLIFWAQTQITSGMASILNATTPLFALTLAHFFTKDEKITRNKLIGIICGIIGVGILINPTIKIGLDLNLAAKLASLSAAFIYGCAVVYTRHFNRFGLSPLQTAYGQLTTSTLMMLIIASIIDAPWDLPIPSLKIISALIALAIASTALAYLLFFRLLARAGATNATLVTLLVPVSANILALMFLEEPFSLHQLVGFIVIACGLLIIDGRISKKLIS